MPTINFYIRDASAKDLPASLIETVNYSDFHKRSETTYPDITITAADIPMTSIVKRDGSIVNFGDVVVSQFTTEGTGIINEASTREVLFGAPITTPVVTPSRHIGDDLRYDWYSRIRFDNAQTINSTVTLIDGSIPEGLTIETGLIQNTYVAFSGNIEDDLFDIDTNAYEGLAEDWHTNQQVSFENIEYIDNLIDKNILSEPSSTFSVGDVITNVDEGSTETREINKIYTYDETKLGIDVTSFVPVMTNYAGSYITTYDSFNVQSSQKFDEYNNALEIDSNWRGYISNASKTIFAQYTDIHHSNITNDVFEKTYTFTLGLSNTDTGLELDRKTFTLVVQASPESLRDNYSSGTYVNVDYTKHFQYYQG